MSKVNIAIVVVAYNRADSLLRLLQSLEKVDYEGQTVPLIISIDYSGENKVFDLADAYKWKFGKKRIIRHSTNLGLKRHVLSCGDLVEDYDAIIVLEDDLYVSPAMYSYAWRAVEKYQNDEDIEAISLYSKIWSETAYLPFMPAFSGYDTYFIQTAESLGQIWFKDKWKSFREWYDKNCESPFEADNIPLNVCQWDQKSWKKYHIKYCIEKNKFTVYPYEALTTCMGDMGEHTRCNTCISQVPIADMKHSNYCFADFKSEDSVKYDAHLERIIQDSTDTCIDLYGQKRSFEGYQFAISSQILNYRVVDSYGLALRPHEENIIQGIKGEDFYKYDLSCTEKNKRRKNREKFFEYYNYSGFSDATNKMLFGEIFCALLHRIGKKIKKAVRKFV